VDTLEKQQTIESIKTIIKARWFYVSAIAVQGVIVRVFFPTIPVPNNVIISLIIIFVFLINFIFWLSMRQQPEKINYFILKIIKFFQVPLEQAGLAVILYFSGTANKMLMMMYIIPIMVAAAIYKRKGIIFATISTMVVYTGLVVIEYFGLMPPLASSQPSQLLGTPLRGNLNLAEGQIIFFNLYILGAAFYAGYLSNLFKRREKRLVEQKNELGQKTNLLAHQTQELTKTKDYLHEALTKSDAARIETEKTKDQLQKSNLDLQAKIRELEKYGQVTTGRELKMMELKKEINNLRGTIKNLQDQPEASKK